MRVIFAGTPDVAVETFHALLRSQHEVVAVLTRAPKAKGRSKKPVPSPVEVAARDAGIDVLTPPTLKNDDIVSQLRGYDAKAAVVVAYGMLIPAAALDIFEHGWLNLHFSLLPKWRGAAPVQHAMLAGDEIQGVSVFRIDAGLDTGPTFAVDPVRVAPNQIADHVLNTLARHGSDIMVRVLDALENGNPTAHPQREEGVCYAPKVDKNFGHINWHLPVERIDNRVRACTSHPGAWTQLANGLKLQVGPMVLRDVDTLLPGQIRVDKHEVSVGTLTTDVTLVNVKPQGKNWMPADAWARGAHLAPGETFVSSTNE